MKSRLCAVALFVMFAVGCMSAQSAPQPPAGRDEGGLGSGVVVEKIDKGFQGEKAGLQPGDILLQWSRDGAKGTITSPYDVFRLEIDERPKGKVVFTGLRGKEPRVWTMGLDLWGLRTKPPMAGSLLEAYSEGEEFAKKKDLAAAVTRWQALARQSATSSVPWLQPWLLYHAALVLVEAQQWKQADEIYQELVQSAAAAGPFVEGQALRSWGTSYQRRNDWVNAEKCYLRAIEALRKADNNELSVALNFIAFGVAAMYQGSLDQAGEYMLKGVAIHEKFAPESLDMAGGFADLALVALGRGDISQAEKYLEHALKITRSLAYGGPNFVVELITLGNVARQRGELAKAEAYYREALEVQEKLESRDRATAGSLTGLGNVARQRGELARAEAYYRRALDLVEKSRPGTLDVAESIASLGDVAEDRGDFKQAGDYFRQAVALREKLSPDSPGLALALTNLGDNLREQGDFAKAQECLEKALEIDKKRAPDGVEYASILRSSGDLARDAGNLAKAEDFYRQASVIWGRLSPGSMMQAENLAELAGILRRKQEPGPAADIYGQALDAMDALNANLGGSNESRAAFRARHENYYRDYVDLLVAQGRFALAFQTLERSRARTLLEMLDTAHADISKGVDPLLLEKQRSLQADINAKSDRRIRLLTDKQAGDQLKAIDKEINELLSQYQDVEGQIRATSPGYAALTQPQPRDTKQIQQLLDNDTLLLEYSLGAERSYVFAVNAHALSTAELPKRAEIDSAARRLYELLTARNISSSGRKAQGHASAGKDDAECLDAAARLSRIILGPLAAQLKGKRLLVVADGALQYIPFAALPEPETQHSGSLAAVPLIVHHEIVTLPSASVLAVLRQQQKDRKPAPRAVAVLADPVFDKQDPRISPAAAPEKESAPAKRGLEGDAPALIDHGPRALLVRSAGDVGLNRDGQLLLPRLLFSRQEAGAIIAATPKGQGLEALDFSASRATAMSPELSQFRIVHFATHGLLNSEHPELSGLVFSLVDKSGKPQDGFLQLQDIYNMNLPADLVVLSACETGLGKEINGEGLIGLTRGFMYAGASRVVASLWKVSDVATAKLMANFYTAMEKDGLAPAAALRAAQIDMWKQKRWRSPYYWAAFQIQGEYK